MNIGKTVRNIISEKRVTQTAVTRQMIKVMPELEGRFSRKKLSAVIKGTRRMTCDEFIAFCMVMNVEPEIFLEAAQHI